MSIFAPGIVGDKIRKTIRNTPEPTEQQAIDMCKAFSTVLVTLYPGHLWEVGMIGNMVYIKNLRLNKEMGYKIHINDIDVEGKALMRVGGEILERFSQRRGRVDTDSLGTLKRNIRGDSLPQT